MATTTTRFFCHSCATEIDNVSNFTCPNCLGGFIEELPANESVVTPSVDSDDAPMNDYLNQHAIRLANEIFSNPILSPLLMPGNSRSGNEASGSVGISASIPPTIPEVDNSTEENGDATNRTRIRYRRRRRYDEQNVTNFDNILQEILISVADTANGGGTPMFFMGNPGDYAWGREGLDTIVTQLLNQMDNTGPPPLEKDKISEIPTVEITSDQVTAKLQCSVCWEDFQVDEIVRKLPCLHVYHENCIIPWLELHSTCPICRKSLAGDQTDEQRNNSWSAAAQAVANTIRNVTSSYRSSDNNDPGATTSTSSTSQINVNNLNNSTSSTSNNVAHSSRTPLTFNNLTNSIPRINSFQTSELPVPRLSNTAGTSVNTATTSTSTNASDNTARRNYDNDGNVDFEYD